jgi:hypothetical protein
VLDEAVGKSVHAAASGRFECRAQIGHRDLRVTADVDRAQERDVASRW